MKLQSFFVTTLFALFLSSIEVQAQKDSNESYKLVKSTEGVSCPARLSGKDLKKFIQNLEIKAKTTNHETENFYEGYGIFDQVTVSTDDIWKLRSIFLLGPIEWKTLVVINYNRISYFPDGSSEFVFRWDCQYVLE